MKPKRYTSLFIVIISLGLFSCKTASKMYEKGNYDEAVELAAKKLQKDPNDPKLLNIIRNAYEYAVNDHESRISDYSASGNDLKWEWIYNEYVSLQKMYDAIYRVPSVLDIIQPVDYTSYLVTYSEKAGMARYDRGIAFMQRYDKQSYRNAYREFQAALRFLPGDVASMQKRDEAFEYAVTNIVMLPLHQQGGYIYSSYRLGSANVDDQLIRDLQYNSGNEFVRYYSAWDARSRNIRADLEIDMRLATMDIGRTYDQHSKRKVSKEIVVKETVYRPDSVVKEYARVTAEITSTKRTMNSSAVMQITARDMNGRRVWGEQVSSDHYWSTEFATFTGDERALSDADKQLINRRREFAPTDPAVLECLLEELRNAAVYRVRGRE